MTPKERYKKNTRSILRYKHKRYVNLKYRFDTKSWFISEIKYKIYLFKTRCVKYIRSVTNKISEYIQAVKKKIKNRLNMVKSLLITNIRITVKKLKLPIN